MCTVLVDTFSAVHSAVSASRCRVRVWSVHAVSSESDSDVAGSDDARAGSDR